MLPEIGLMIGMYIIARSIAMMELGKVAKIAGGFLAGVLALIVMIALIDASTTATTQMEDLQRQMEGLRHMLR